jgi:hypothetical protein
MDYRIVCGECGKDLVLSNSRAAREHGDGVYSFLCKDCSGL